MKWNDVTSYSRGERGTVEPRSWELAHCGMRLCVHRLHRVPGWYLSANEIGIDRRFVHDDNLEEAKRVAIDYVRSFLQQKLDGLNSATQHKSEGREGA